MAEEVLKVLVDTSIWSLALRRRAHQLSSDEQRLVDELAEVVREGRATILGAVRQELLTGIRTEPVFERVRERVRNFRDEPLTVEDYEEAARHTNTCLRAGIAGSAVDFLICAAASRRDFDIYTTDPDFERYAKHLPVRLYHPRKRD